MFDLLRVPRLLPAIMAVAALPWPAAAQTRPSAATPAARSGVMRMRIVKITGRGEYILRESPNFNPAVEFKEDWRPMSRPR